MHLLRNFALFALLAASAPLASAGTITYNLLGASTSAGTLSGTVTVSTATDLVTSADLTLDDPSLGSPVFQTVGLEAAYNGLSQDYLIADSTHGYNYGGQIALFFNTAGLSSGGNLSLCTSAATCGSQGLEPSLVTVFSTSGTQSFDITAGTLSTSSSTTSSTSAVQSAVPEPDSLLLLGTGIFATALLIAYRASRLPRAGGIGPADLGGSVGAER